jgi:succinoglycan biosynthesis transport protein ExoP
MTLWEMLLLVRERWRIILTSLAVCLLAAAAAATLAPKEYSAVARMYATSTGAQDPASLAQGTTYMRQQIQSYPGIVTSPLVLRPVIKELSLDESPTELASRVTASVPMDTTWVDISVRASESEQAARVATSVGESFISVVEELETRPGADQSPVRVTLVDKPEAPSDPVSPNLRMNLLVGGIVGLVLGVLLAVLRHAQKTDATRDRRGWNRQSSDVEDTVRQAGHQRPEATNNAVDEDSSGTDNDSGAAAPR